MTAAVVEGFERAAVRQRDRRTVAEGVVLIVNVAVDAALANQLTGEVIVKPELLRFAAVL